MKYKLIHYSTDVHGKNCYCTLVFDRYLFGIKLGKKSFRVTLTHFVTWCKFFDFWDKAIKEGSYFTGKRYSKLHWSNPSTNNPENAALRSKTFLGIAAAMADQWSKIL